jgi:hypothetical protein
MTTKIPSIQLTNKFIEGLKKYEMSYEDIIESKWEYCGGNRGSHLNYFKLRYPKGNIPDSVDECVCGHKISENCYITDGNEILVMGNCCIKKFIKKSGRTCEKCGNPHKNRVVNKCNDCRSGFCDDCGKECNEYYKKCYKCLYV